LRFTALLHHVYNPEMLRQAYFSLKREAAPGVDGQTWRHYGERLEENLHDLSGRLKRGAYRAKPVRRVYIPKADGRQRPLGVTALEDKIVQRATVEVLNTIYETDFLGFSYGFRPGRSQHNALDALDTGLLTRKVNWVLDADIRGYFDAIDHGWLVEFVEHRIADRRVVRLIQKWLNAGVLEDGTRTRSELGTPQGGSASPLLANVYLHYGAAENGCPSSGCESRPGNRPVGRVAYSTVEEATNRQKARAYKVPGCCKAVPNGQGGERAGGPQHEGMPAAPKQVAPREAVYGRTRGEPSHA
jgi:group II intron reverse transcriptase/maturase